MPTLRPAYGRDFNSAEEARADFAAGRDFILSDPRSPWDGKPCSIRDFPPLTPITLRYGRLRRATAFTIPAPAADATTATVPGDSHA